MATITRFEDLEAWVAARQLAAQVYAASRRKPFATDRSLCDQIRQAAVSVGSNIAEGFERDGAKSFGQFLRYAKGSAGEVKAQLYVALDQGYLEQAEFDVLYASAHSVGRLIGGMIRYLRLRDTG